MIKLIDLLKESEAEGPKCPVATQNDDVNVKHRQLAIDNVQYGPKNPNNPNVKYWKNKAQIMGLEAMESAKASRCNNCAYFNITSGMLGCIGVSEPEPEPTETVSAPQEAPVKTESLREFFRPKLKGIIKEADDSEEEQDDTDSDNDASTDAPVEKSPIAKIAAKPEPKAAAPAPKAEPKAPVAKAPVEKPAPEPESTEDDEVEEPEDENIDIWDKIEAGKMGYCMLNKFKASGSRTCNKWKTGGPYKDR